MTMPLNTTKGVSLQRWLWLAILGGISIAFAIDLTHQEKPQLGHGGDVAPVRASEAHEKRRSSFVNVVSMAMDAVRSRVDQGARELMSPMEHLGYVNVTKRDPFNTFHGGPAGRLGLDVHPVPFMNETDAVKSYEFKSIPLDTRPPMKISEVEDKIPPAYNVFLGVFFGFFVFIPIGLIYVGMGTENSLRNILMVVMCLGMVGLLSIILERCGVFESIWASHVRLYGQSWFEAVFMFPLALLVIVAVMDVIVRGENAMLVRVSVNFFERVSGGTGTWDALGSGRGGSGEEGSSGRTADMYYYDSFGQRRQNKSAGRHNQDWLTRLLL